MKVKLLLLTMLVMIFLPAGSVFAAEAVQAPNPIEVPDIRIIMDGRLEQFEKVPVSVNNRTLLPFRELLVKLGVPNDDEHIIYNHAEKSVTVWYGQTKIYLRIGQNEAFVNDEPITLDVAPILYKNSTYVPLRFLAESMGKKVVWDGASRAVLICDAEKYNNIKQIMDKSAKEMAKVKKYKLDMNVICNIESDDFSGDIAIDSSMLVDMLNKKMNTNQLINFLGMQMSTEIYFADNASYTLSSFQDNWSKKIYADTEYDEFFKTQSNVIENEDILSDILLVGLNQVNSENDDEILFIGDVLSLDLIVKALSQQDLDYTRDIDEDITYDDFSMAISLNKTTYLINYISFSMKILQHESENEDGVTMSAKVEYSDYDGDFVITVPEDVIENAVLIDDMGNGVLPAY
ncbi:MAG: DUF6612 family protein [Bacillota bacterium]